MFDRSKVKVLEEIRNELKAGNATQASIDLTLKAILKNLSPAPKVSGKLFIGVPVSQK